VGLTQKKIVTPSEARGLFINYIIFRCLASLDMIFITFWTASEVK